MVAPLAGAWIETEQECDCRRVTEVAPLAGAWIETVVAAIISPSPWSLPSRERGLKLSANPLYLRAARRPPRGRGD